MENQSIKCERVSQSEKSLNYWPNSYLSN